MGVKGQWVVRGKGDGDRGSGGHDFKLGNQGRNHWLWYLNKDLKEWELAVQIFWGRVYQRVAGRWATVRTLAFTEWRGEPLKDLEQTLIHSDLCVALCMYVVFCTKIILADHSGLKIDCKRQGLEAERAFRTPEYEWMMTVARPNRADFGGNIRYLVLDMLNLKCLLDPSGESK